MKKLFTILSIFICFFAHGQGDPKNVPSSKTRWVEAGWLQSDSGNIVANRDTNWLPRYRGTMVFWQNVGVDSSFWGWDGFKWNKVGSGSGGSETLQEVFDNQNPAIFDKTNQIDINNNNFIITNGNQIGIRSFSSTGLNGLFLTTDYAALQANGHNYIEIDGTANTATLIRNNSDALNIVTSVNNVLADITGNVPATEDAEMNWILTSKTAGGFNKSSFSSVADSLQPYLLSGDTTFQWSVDSTVNASPVGTGSGSKVRVGTSPSGAFIGHNNQIATSDGIGGFTYQTATSGDLLYDANTDLVSKWNGSVWSVVGRAAIHQGLDRFGAAIKIGAADNFPFNIYTNNAQRFQISATGTPRFFTLTGASAGLMGLSTAGVGSNVQIGTGLQLLAGVLSSTVSGGVTTANNGLNLSTATNVQLGGALVANTTISGAFTMTWTPSRFIVSSADSVSIISVNNATLGSIGGTLTLSGATITAKGTTSTFGSSTKSIFHYETGTSDSIAIEVKALGMRFVGITTITPSAADKPLQRDTVTGLIQQKLIDISNSTSQITGTLAYGNGGTGATSFTNHGVVVAGASALTTVAPSTSGNVLTSNGTDWVSSASASPFTRGVMLGVNSTNLIYQVTQSDSAVFGVLASGTPIAKYEFVGTVGITGVLSTLTNVSFASGAAIINASGRLALNSSAVTAGWAISMQNWPGNGGGILFSGNTGSQTEIGMSFRPNITSTTTTSTEVIGFQSQITQTNASNIVNTGIKGFSSEYTIGSTSSTALPYYYGAYIAPVAVSGGTQQMTNAYGVYVGGIAGTTDAIGTAYYGVYIDATAAAAFSGGSAFGLYQLDNATLSINNIIQSKSSFGTTTAPTALVYIGASTTSVASLNIQSGSAPSSPNAGDFWVASNDLNVRLNSKTYLIDKSLSGSGTLDFGNTAAGTSTDLTITVTGAADGDVVMLGTPNGSTSANGCFTAWVSAANTVTVRFTNTNLVSAIDPASGTFKVRVIQ